MRADLAVDLALARQLGDMAGAIALGYFGTNVRRELKADGSPVTEADLAVERAVLDVLARERPDDGVLSEERGAVARGETDRRWLIDPIDGTAPFLAGTAGWGTHVALEVGGEIVLGVITRPAEHRSWWATKGQGAWTSPATRLNVSTRSSLARCPRGRLHAPRIKVASRGLADRDMGGGRVPDHRIDRKTRRCRPLGRWVRMGPRARRRAPPRSGRPIRRPRRRLPDRHARRSLFERPSAQTGAPRTALTSLASGSVARLPRRATSRIWVTHAKIRHADFARRCLTQELGLVEVARSARSNQG